MSFAVDQLWWLHFAVAAVPLAILGASWMSGIAHVRRLSAIGSRVLLMLALALLLAGASLVRTSDRLTVIALVDRSASVVEFAPVAGSDKGRSLAATVQRDLDRWAVDRRPDDQLGVVYFDSRPTTVQLPTTSIASTLPPLKPEAGGTDLARALRLGAAMIPADSAGRLLVFSDGNQTTGDALKAASELQSRQRGRLPIDVVPIDYAVPHETYIESVDAPQTAPSAATITLRVVLRSTQPVSGWLRVTENQAVVDVDPASDALSRRVDLPAGRHVELISVPLGDARTHRFDVFWDPDTSAESPTDTALANNTGSAFTVSPGRGQVLVVSGAGIENASASSTLTDALSASGFNVRTAGPEGIPSDLLALQDTDLLILDNVASDAIAPASQQALARYVTDLGGGLIMVGGRSSFGAGGWRGSPVEPLLPVKLDLPERLVTPSTAIMLVIDNSGSMNRSVLGSDRTQQEIACEGAALAIESLDKNDLIGVVVFNSTAQVRIPLRRNLDAKENARIVRSTSADGGTNMPPALIEAHKQLKAAVAETKHVIVLSDGVSLNKEQVPSIVQSMAKDGITVSSISVGDGADIELLSTIAQDGGGVFYRVSDPTLLPRVFVKAVRVVRTPMIREEPFSPVRLPSGSSVLQGLSTLPSLGGVTLTQARTGARVDNILATPLGEPLLSTWNAGLGRVGAFTSDSDAWSRTWRNDATYSTFWTQFARAMSRPSNDRTHSIELAIQSGTLVARLEALNDDGTPVDGLSLPAKIYAPDGRVRELQLHQVGPGEYQAQTDAAEGLDGVYVLTVSPRVPQTPDSAAKVLSPIIAGVVRPAGDEYRALTSNRSLLESLANSTGGRVLPFASEPGPDPAPSPVTLFDRTNVQPARARLPLWKWLMFASIAMLLVDVGTRRIAWDRLLSREFGARARSHASPAQASTMLDRLRGVGSASAADPSLPSPAALDDSDAQAIVIAQRERRERKGLQPLTPSQPAAAPGKVIDIESPKAPGDTPEDQGGLLAAKRRARRRFEEGGS